MDTDLTAQLAAARTASTRHSLAIAVVKKNHEMEMSLVTMLDQAVKAAPPPGQGVRLDKLA
jgi:cation transport ATPase